MTRLVAAVLVAGLIVGLTLDDLCLVSCTSERHDATSSTACHETPAPESRLVTAHDCSSHVQLRDVAARIEHPQCPSSACALTVARVELVFFANPATGRAFDLPAPSPPFGPPLLVAVRI